MDGSKPFSVGKIGYLPFVLSAASLLAAAAQAQERTNASVVPRVADAVRPSVSTIGPLRRGADGKIELAVPNTAHEESAAPSATVAAVTNNELDGGHWVAAPNSRLEAIIYRGPEEHQLNGNTGPAAIMSAWSGAAFDSERHTLLVWGGGHGDYHGNAVYSFSIRSQSWSMLSRPSSIADWSGSTSTLPDGTPAVPHTYDALAFVPAMNGLFVAGTPANHLNGNGGPSSWLFEIATRKWRELALNKLLGGVGTIAAYNPADQNVYVINSAIGLQRYNVASNSWSAIGHRPISDYHLTGAIDPEEGTLVATGAGFLNVVKLSTGEVTSPMASGDMTVENGNAPGFVWDGTRHQFVGWNGGSMLYTLDPHSYRWAAHHAAPNSLVPTPPASNGTFGRFQFDAAEGKFLLVNGVDQDVFLYEPRSGERNR